MNLLTADQAVKLAEPCLWIVMGLAQVIFPGSGRGRPSSYVMVIKVGDPLSGGGRFVPPLGDEPVCLDSGQWRTCVQPLLEDRDRWDPYAPLWVSDPNRWDQILILLRAALKNSFQTQGY